MPSGSPACFSTTTSADATGPAELEGDDGVVGGRW